MAPSAAAHRAVASLSAPIGVNQTFEALLQCSLMALCFSGQEPSFSGLTRGTG